MGHTPTAMDTDQQFPPATVFNLWHLQWPHEWHHLHNMIQPCAHEIALEESDQIIRDSSLQIQIKTLTIKEIQELLQLDALVEKFKKSAPFIFGLLHNSSIPNPDTKIMKMRIGTMTRMQKTMQAMMNNQAKTGGRIMTALAITQSLYDLSVSAQFKYILTGFAGHNSHHQYARVRA